MYNTFRWDRKLEIESKLILPRFQEKQFVYMHFQTARYLPLMVASSPETLLDLLDNYFQKNLSQHFE